MGGLAQGAHNIGEAVAWFEGAQLAGGDTHRLNHERDGTSLGIGVGYSEGNALAILTTAHNHKVTSTSRAGNERSLNHEFGHILRKFFFTDNFVHFKEFELVH